MFTIANAFTSSLALRSTDANTRQHKSWQHQQKKKKNYCAKLLAKQCANKKPLRAFVNEENESKQFNESKEEEEEEEENRGNRSNDEDDDDVDIEDPKQRERAMKEAEQDILKMAEAEADVINQTYDMIERLTGLKVVAKRPERRKNE